MMPPPDPLLAGHQLACTRGGRALFEGLEIETRAGDLVLVRGPNGSGKSSLLRLLAGLLPVAGGELFWAGEPVRHDPAGHRARLHFIGPQDAQKPALTGRENLAAARGLLGGRGGLAAALDGLGVRHLADLPARLFSTGQRRRAALARLLAAPRPFWVLDEPETGLDREGRATLVDLVAAQRAAGGLVVVASHDDDLWRPSVVLDLG